MKPESTPEIFSDEALQQVIEDISPILDRLPPEMVVLTENLYSRKTWKETSNSLHSLFGMQIAYLVKNKRIRLAFAGGNEAVQRFIVISEI